MLKAYLEIEDGCNYDSYTEQKEFADYKELEEFINSMHKAMYEIYVRRIEEVK